MSITNKTIVNCDYCGQTLEQELTIDYAHRIDSAVRRYMQLLREAGWVWYQNEDGSFRIVLCPKCQSKDLP